MTVASSSRSKKHISILNVTRGCNLGEKISIADTSLSRFVGLLGRRGLSSSEGLLIQPSNGVHTLGMLFSIDVLLIDKDWKVVVAYPSLRPFRITRLNWKASRALELPSGTIHHTGTSVGDVLARAT